MAMKLKLDRKSSEANVFSMKSRTNVANSGQKYCFTKRKKSFNFQFSALLCTFHTQHYSMLESMAKRRPKNAQMDEQD